MKEVRVLKRDGRHELLDLSKLHKVVFWATEGIANVSPSEVELKSHIQFYDGIKSSDIQELLIRSAADLISVENPNYQYVAARLVVYNLRKTVYGKYEPIHISEILEKNINLGFYDEELASKYSIEEWNKIDSFIKHDRDMLFAYAGIEQFRNKYLVQNRVTKEILETPQIAYILIAATLFANYPVETRLDYVKDYYDAISKFDISLPTPIMAGLRTPQRQFSSCTVIECDDSLDSINATSNAIVKYVSRKAGIGIGAGRIRAVNSPIRKGDAYHTGVTPFYKLFQAATKSTNQGGVRSGSTTLTYQIWHYEIEDMLVLKNNKGTEDNRARHMDYCVQFNKLMYERLINNQNITLFSPHDVPKLYEAFFSDQDLFKKLYEAAEKNTKIRKKTISAFELFTKFITERKETGRVYLMNVDNANDHGSFNKEKYPIRLTNLCTEINLATVPMGTYEKQYHKIDNDKLPQFLLDYKSKNINARILGINDTNVMVETVEDKSLIGLCTLSAVNMGNMKQLTDLEKTCDLTVRGLDELLSYQDYPVLAAANHTKLFRPLGVGIINFAYWLAKNDLRYSDDSALEKVDEFMEAMSYYLIKASADIAKEKGACEASKDVAYGKGILPIDTYKRDVDELVPANLRMPWEELRVQLKETGIRNTTLMALMPSDTSSVVSNATSGIEPPRSLISFKQSKDGVLKQVVPEIKRLKNKYELLWDQPSPEGYLKICAILQKYIDQGISVNTSYNPKFYPDEKIPMSEMLKHLLMFYKFGGKQLYYFNSNDRQGEIDTNSLIESAIDTSADNAEEDCEACTI